MKPADHISSILSSTHRLQAEGHCNGNAPAFVAVNDIEIAAHDLRKALEDGFAGGFPGMTEWQAEVIKRDDSDQYSRRTFYEYYRTKYEIARQIMPISIAEIGVRYGYSAFSFLSAVPNAFYYGFDILAGTHGGARGVDTFGYVYKLLGSNFPNATISLQHCDTRTVEDLGGPYQFIHIDGDHTIDGCIHDLELALSACRAGGTILVDDYNYIKGVKEACRRFAEKNLHHFRSMEARQSLRGEFIFRKK